MRHGRLEVELPAPTLAESRFALAALERLPADPQAGDLLRKLLRRPSPTRSGSGLDEAAGEELVRDAEGDDEKRGRADPQRPPGQQGEERDEG